MTLLYHQILFTRTVLEIPYRPYTDYNHCNTLRFLAGSLYRESGRNGKGCYALEKTMLSKLKLDSLP